jgi:hypothetical protein
VIPLLRACRPERCLAAPPGAALRLTSRDLLPRSCVSDRETCRSVLSETYRAEGSIRRAESAARSEHASVRVRRDALGVTHACVWLWSATRQGKLKATQAPSRASLGSPAGGHARNP